MDAEDFCRNLALLCSYEKSIAEVCRRLGLNRQQFNKYLAGSVFPSRSNLRLICDHFGVLDSEILLPHANFAEIIKLKPRNDHAAPVLTPATQTLRRLEAQSETIPDRYLGYYFRYYYSFAFPGYITKSLVRIYRKNRICYWKNIEIIRRRDRSEQTEAIFKYLGLVTFILDRLFVFEEEVILKNSVTQTILYPSHASRIHQLIGIQTATSNLNRRTPATSRVLLEFISPSIDARKALSCCGQFPEHDKEIRPDIEQRISNRMARGEKVLGAWVDV
jgi:transcriptional regulator with XRE-family HTH domain